MKTLLISDSIGLGIMEVRPEPAWLVRLTALRNKDLLAPDYGAMHVAAYLKGTGHNLDVINLVADVHDRAGLFLEPNTDPGEVSGSTIGKPEAAAASRRYLIKRLREQEPDVILFPLSIYNLALYSRKLLADIKEDCPDLSLIHISEPTRLGMISYAVFCLKKKKKKKTHKSKKEKMKKKLQKKKDTYKTI